ncbi:MAG TPA: AMP-binding protein, partial [Actinoplanes sp.]
MSVLAWLDDPRSDRGMHVPEPGGRSWRFHSYADLALMARRAARRLRAAGVASGDVVIIVRAASPEFMADFFGAILLGATPSPIAPPAAFRDRSAYLDHLVRAVRLVGARIVATTAETASVAGPALAEHGCGVVTDIPETLAPLTDPPIVPAIGVIQFSSGSTGPPRAVRIPFAAVQSNVTALRRALRLTERDASASWLPMHHDMGLVGLFLLPIDVGIDMSLLRPEDFIRSPLRWLERFGPGGATMTGTPTFGLAQVVRRVRREQLAGLDLSRWRGIVVGAERVDIAILDAFLDLLAPCGLRPDVMMPSYGLAESTLAVTTAPCSTALTTVTVDGASLVAGRPVVTIADRAAGTTLVGCGTPVSGVAASVVDEDGRPVGE